MSNPTSRNPAWAASARIDAVFTLFVIPAVYLLVSTTAVRPGSRREKAPKRWRYAAFRRRPLAQ
jgi:hypothetical protein